MGKRFASIASFWILAIILTIIERYVQKMTPFATIEQWIASHTVITLVILGIALIACILWGICGNVIFNPLKWSRYVTIKREHYEYEVPEELARKIIEPAKPEGKVIHIEGKLVRTSHRIKKKDMYKEKQ